MKIAVIDTTVHGDMIGGGHLIAERLLVGFVARGHDVHFISADTPNRIILKRLEASGATMHKRIWPIDALVDDSTPIFADWMNDLAPDVHLISTSGDLGWTVLPHLDPKIATLTIGHNDEKTFYAPVQHYAKFLTRAVGVSEEICRKYVNDCGMPEDRVEWIPYGVETSDIEPVTSTSGPLRLVYVGRFDGIQKRMGDIVAIINRLSESGLDFRFDLVGDGDEMPNVKTSLAGEIETGRVVLHGWVDSASVQEILRSGEVFVLASAYEGFCIALTEAMSNGCCPVVTDIRSGNKQLVEDGVNGFVVPVGDIDGFVDRITRMANDREMLGRLRLAAWRTGREYGLDRMVDNFVDCFEIALVNARVSPRTPEPGFPLMESCRSKYPLWLRRMKAGVGGRR